MRPEQTPFGSLVVPLLFLALLSPALGEDGPGSGDGRFMFKSVEEGVIRLDTRTGQVALCARHEAGWACQTTPDERAALEAEIARLGAETGALKRELLTRGIALPGAVRSDTPKPEAQPREDGRPGHSDVDRMLTLLQDAWRRLVEMMRNLQQRT